jgi:spectinomycin phosphotransferase
MLKEPVFEENQICDRIRDEYGLSLKKISHLPLGADRNTFVFHAITTTQTSYFVKLKKGNFNEASVAVPNFLRMSGIKHIIPALATQAGQLWTNFNTFKMILYPFVEGHPGFEGIMSKQQWHDFGKALKQIHIASIPESITSGIQKDGFSPQWRDAVKRILARIENQTFYEPIAVEIVVFLKSKMQEILEIIRRNEQLAQILLEQPLEFILCHSDIHGWNLHIDNDGSLYIVDWDAATFAPKERDLMFIGGGHGDSGYSPMEEETMFYQGYGATNINQSAIAYYRYDRILNDIAEDCNLIFLSDSREEERKDALEDVKSMFLPNGKIAMAYLSDNVF